MPEMILYHGSASIVGQPEFSTGTRHNDYGRGFYCTKSIDLAKEWAVAENRDGYINKYSIDLHGLKVLDLQKKGFTALHWVTLLLQNRVFTLKNDIIKAGKEYLIEHFSLPVNEYDIIKGYRGDDSYFAYAEGFLNNMISYQSLSTALKVCNLGEQVVLMSEKAFMQLKFAGYELVDSATWYPARKARNEFACLKFLSSRCGAFVPDDIYLVDIIRGGIEPDDPRLQ